jgi:hypothetical protein
VPTNHHFASGSFSGWTTTGTASIQSDTPHGSHAELGTSGVLISSACTGGSDAQAFLIDIGYLSTSGSTRGNVEVLHGANYGTSTLLQRRATQRAHPYQWGSDATEFRVHT